MSEEVKELTIKEADEFIKKNWVSHKGRCNNHSK